MKQLRATSTFERLYFGGTVCATLAGALIWIPLALGALAAALFVLAAIVDRRTLAPRRPAK
jgi:hypothetical protein